MRRFPANLVVRFGVPLGLLLILIGGSAALAPAPVRAAPPPPAPACAVAPFTDVQTDHPFCPEIQWMKNNGISTGFNDGTYRPSSNVTRQAMSAFLTRLAGSAPGACASAPFGDVATGHPFCKEIQWMKDQAISTGFDDGTYRPAIDVTRQAMSAFLAREAGAAPAVCSSPPFTDVPINHPFCKEIGWMKDNSISTGFNDGTYRPAINVTRQAMSAFLYRASFLVGKVPVVTVSIGDAGYVEDGAAAMIDPGLSVTDADDPNLTTATVSITSAKEASDVLGFVNTPQITGSYNSGTGVLTLTGTTTVANYQAALRSVTFANNNDPVLPSRTIAFRIKDNALWSDAKTRNVNVAPNNDSPVADDETFDGTSSAIGNTLLVVNDPTDGAPANSSPKKSITGDLLAGDSDVDGPGPLTITPGTSATASGGSVTIEADGDFTYVSNGCPASDTFNYTVNDNGSPNRTDTGTVTVAIVGCVWWVSNNATGNAGTSAAPFDTLAQAQTASQPLHTIFVYDGNNTTTGYDAGITLKNNQRLFGENVTLTMPNTEHAGVTLWTATANRPTITDSNADVIELASANEVRGFEINPSGTGGGIAGSGVTDTSGTIADVRIVDTGTAGQQPMFELNATAGTWNISDLFIDNTGATSPPNTATGVLLLNAGTVNFLAAGAITIVTTVAPGLDAQGTNMGTSVFDAISVSSATNGGIRLVSNTGSTTLGDGVGTDLNINTASGAAAAILLNAPGSVGVDAAGTDSVSSNGGPALSVVSGSGVSELSFESVTSTNSASDGIALGGLTTATFSSVSGSISGAAGTAFAVAGGSGAITYPGNIGNGVGQTASITGRTGGVITLSGSIADNSDAGGGITMTGNSGGSTLFSNSAKTLNTGSSSAVLFNTSDGHTLTFSNGGLDIDTAAGKGIESVTSGTLVITGANNSITSGSGTALNLTNTDIGVGGLNFVSISAAGGTNGILLSGTGSTAGVTVTGTGTTAASGGTISGMTGADSTTTGIGVYLNDTRNVSLANMSFTGTFSNFGIRGEAVTNFTLTDSSLTGTFGDNGSVDEDTIRFGTQGSGTGLTGTAVFQGNTIQGAKEANVSVYVYGANTLNLTIKDTAGGDQAVFGNNQDGTGTDDFILESGGTSNVTVTVTGVQFNGSRGDLMQVSSIGSATQSISITNNQFHNAQVTTLDGGAAITITGNLTNSNISYNIDGNSFKGTRGASIFSAFNGTSGTVNGIVNMNTFGTNNGVKDADQANYGSLFGGAFFGGIDSKSPGSGVINYALRISNNTIRDSGSDGAIMLRSASQDLQGSARLEATIHNNTIAEVGANVASGVYAQVAGSGSLGGDAGKMGLNITSNSFIMTGAVAADGVYIDNGSSLNGLAYLPGYGGSATSAANVKSYLDGKSNTFTNANASGTNGAGLNGSVSAGNFVLTVP